MRRGTLKQRQQLRLKREEPRLKAECCNMMSPKFIQRSLANVTRETLWQYMVLQKIAGPKSANQFLEIYFRCNNFLLR